MVPGEEKEAEAFKPMPLNEFRSIELLTCSEVQPMHPAETAFQR